MYTAAAGTGTLRPLTLYTGSNTNQLYLDPNGRIGLNTSDPQEMLHVKDGDILISSNQPSGGDGVPTMWFSESGGLTRHASIFYDGGNRSDDDNVIVFKIGGDLDKTINDPSTKMVITRGGRVGIGTVSPGYTLDVNGSINASGTVHANGEALTSDKRYKKDITPIPGALQKVDSLTGVYYSWRSDEFAEKNFSDARQVGLIAQEVEAVLPEAVHTGADGYKSLEYNKLTALLVEAVKQQQRQIQQQQDQIETLQAQMDAMLQNR